MRFRAGKHKQPSISSANATGTGKHILCLPATIRLDSVEVDQGKLDFFEYSGSRPPSRS